MKTSHLLLVLALSLGPAGMAHAELNVLGFQAWKSSRVDEAKSVLDKLNTELAPTLGPTVVPPQAGKAPAAKSTPGKNARVDQRLQQAQLNIEIAQELTVNDYFVLYLNQFKEKEAFLEAAKKLSADETADLMMAYQKRLSVPEQSEAQVPQLLMGAGAVGNAKASKAGL